MKVLNLMWSSQPAFHSVHRVMASVVRALQPGQVEHGFIIGEASQQQLLSPAFSWRSSKRESKKWWPRRKLLKQIKQRLVNSQPEVVILDGMGVARLVLPLLTLLPGCPVIIYFHGQTSFKKNDLKLLNAARKQNLKLVAVSASLADSLRKQVSHIEVLAIPTFLYLPACVRKNIETNDRLRLGAVGRLVKDKNFSLLIQMMAQLVKKNNYVTLQLAGEGSEFSSLQKQIDDLQLQDQVKLLGHQEDIKQFYQTIDVLLVPSLQEGQGLIVQEALHYGAVVLCSDLPVFREQLGEAGCYLSTELAAEWVSAVENLNFYKLGVLLAEQQRAYAAFCNETRFKKSLLDAIGPMSRAG